MSKSSNMLIHIRISGNYQNVLKELLSVYGLRIKGIFMDSSCGLTKREIEILKLVIKGRSNQFIAKKLCVNECTIKAHIGHIFKKMKVQNLVQAAVKAITKNIV